MVVSGGGVTAVKTTVRGCSTRLLLLLAVAVTHCQSSCPASSLPMCKGWSASQPGLGAVALLVALLVLLLLLAVVMAAAAAGRGKRQPAATRAQPCSSAAALLGIRWQPPATAPSWRRAAATNNATVMVH